MNSNQLLKIENCNFQYSVDKNFVITKAQVRKTKPVVLKNINLELKKNKVYGVIGPNGAGKSTLLKLIFNFIKPGNGKIHRNFNSGKLIENAGFFHEELSAYENFRAFYLMEFDYDLKSESFKDKQDLFIYLTQLNNEDLNKPVVNLSRGMRSKVGFGLTMSFLDNVDFIGLDEFFSFGDDSYKSFSSNYIKTEIKNTGSAILVSHSVSLIGDMCDEVIYINEGTVVDCGTPKDVINQYLASIGHQVWK
jgi:ABC-type polysaccharide/polyol phosphate transport system ATPase subunit